MKFSIGVLCKKLPSKHEFRENRVIKGANKFLSVIFSDCDFRKIRPSKNEALATGIKEPLSVLSTCTVCLKLGTTDMQTANAVDHL
jgi:hypothetical protein